MAPVFLRGMSLNTPSSRRVIQSSLPRGNIRNAVPLSILVHPRNLSSIFVKRKKPHILWLFLSLCFDNFYFCSSRNLNTMSLVRKVSTYIRTRKRSASLCCASIFSISSFTCASSGVIPSSRAMVLRIICD